MWKGPAKEKNTAGLRLESKKAEQEMESLKPKKVERKEESTKKKERRLYHLVFAWRRRKWNRRNPPKRKGTQNVVER